VGSEHQFKRSHLLTRMQLHVSLRFRDDLRYGGVFAIPGDVVEGSGVVVEAPGADHFQCLATLQIEELTRDRTAPRRARP
jgi:hypothetical protein